MKRIALVALTALMVALLVPTATVSAHNARLKCGSKPGGGAGWSHLRSHNGIGCPRAKELAQRWEDKCIWNNNCPGEPDKIKSVEPGFRCRHEKVGYETVRVRCTADEGPGVVHFLWGS